LPAGEATIQGAIFLFGSFAVNFAPFKLKIHAGYGEIRQKVSIGSKEISGESQEQSKSRNETQEGGKAGSEEGGA
jgi:hypothetical protein